MPSAIPSDAPISAVITLSCRIMPPYLTPGHSDRTQHAQLARALEDREHQCVDDPEQAHDHGERKQHVEQVEQGLIESCCASENPSRVSTLTAGKSSIACSSCCSACGGSAGDVDERVQVPRVLELSSKSWSGTRPFRASARTAARRRCLYVGSSSLALRVRSSNRCRPPDSWSSAKSLLDDRTAPDRARRARRSTRPPSRTRKRRAIVAGSTPVTFSSSPNAPPRSPRTPTTSAPGTLGAASSADGWNGVKLSSETTTYYAVTWSDTALPTELRRPGREDGDKRDQREPDHQRGRGGRCARRVAHRVLSGQPAGAPADFARGPPEDARERLDDLSTTSLAMPMKSSEQPTPSRPAARRRPGRRRPIPFTSSAIAIAVVSACDPGREAAASATAAASHPRAPRQSAGRAWRGCAGKSPATSVTRMPATRLTTIVRAGEDESRLRQVEADEP